MKLTRKSCFLLHIYQLSAQFDGFDKICDFVGPNQEIDNWTSSYGTYTTLFVTHVVFNLRNLP